jgi:hypothetical protein
MMTNMSISSGNGASRSRKTGRPESAMSVCHLLTCESTCVHRCGDQTVSVDLHVIDNCFLILLVGFAQSVVSNYILLADHLHCNICE